LGDFTFAEIFFNCSTFTVYIIATPDPITVTIDETCGYITAIIFRRLLVYPFLKLVFTETPRFLVSYDVDTGEVVDESFGGGIDGIVRIKHGKSSLYLLPQSKDCMRPSAALMYTMRSVWYDV
jgi:hypothetical protein